MRRTDVAEEAPGQDLEQDERLEVSNLKDVPLAASGTASVGLGGLARGNRVEADALIDPGDGTGIEVVRSGAVALLRPDLVVASVQAPAQTLSVRAVDVRAEIAERNGDVGAKATATLAWGPSLIATQQVEVAPGDNAAIVFEAVALTTPVPVDLTVRVGDATPAETDATNNDRSATVDVTEHELVRYRLLLDHLGGYGAQFNQHVFAQITPAPPGSLPELEAKVKALEPQLVRIFFSEPQDVTIADRNASFVETVRLANDAGATINITYQTTVRAKLQPALYMGQFASILDDLVRTQGLPNVRWITFQNEVNATAVTFEQYDALYRALEAALEVHGLSDQIGLMGGDLVQNKQRIWFTFMGEHMADVLDAYSVHVYWDYWDTAKLANRLKDVRKIVTEELPAAARKPTYITESGVTGITNFPGKPVLEPGYSADGAQIARTNISAFQQLWFDVVSAQLGFSGTVKWDAYWGKYDAGNQAYYMIGPAAEGWPLFPAYHATRLLQQTTARGWQILGVDPWADDDWAIGSPDQPEKELAAYAGPNGELTLIGLDTNGGQLNASSPETPTYSVGGLPALTTFTLAVWNAPGNGENAIAVTVTTNAAGVARFEVPLHGAFALTTVPVA